MPIILQMIKVRRSRHANDIIIDKGQDVVNQPVSLISMSLPSQDNNALCEQKNVIDETSACLDSKGLENKEWNTISTKSSNTGCVWWDNSVCWNLQLISDGRHWLD